MSEETTASAPEAAAAPEASAPDDAMVETASTIDAVAEPGADTVMLGDVAVPLAALADLPDDVLRNLKRTVKVNGEEREVSIADALQAVSRAEGADAKMREAARMRRLMLEDPLSAVQELARIESERQKLDVPLDGRALLETALLRQFEQESMTDEERAQWEMEQKAKAFEEYQRAEKERRAQAQHQQHVETMRTQMGEALERAGVAGDGHVFTRAVTIMQGLVAAKGDIPDAQLAAAMDKAVGLAADELGKARTSWLDVEDDAALLERIPADVQRRIARAYAAKTKKAASSPRRPAGEPKAPAVDVSKMTPTEWRAWLAERDAKAAG